MARIWTEGFEAGDGLWWDIAPSSGISSGVHRTGTYSWQCTGADTGTKNLSDVIEFYLRVGFYVNEIGGTYNVVRWRHGTTTLGGVYVNMANPGYRIDVTVNDVVVATGTNNLLALGWNFFEVHVKIDDSGQIQTKVNGITDITYNGDTKPGADTHADNLYFACQGGHYSYLDDLAFNDTTGGAPDNSWCGDGHIEYFPANAEGDTLQWTPSTGTTHYTMVDEIPPNSDTDYVYCSGSNASFQDMYNVVDFTSTGKVVKRVWAEGRAKDSAGTGGGIKLGYKTSGCIVLSSASKVLPSNYIRIIGDDAIISPYTSASWTGTDLNSIQFVIECE